jgi:hypothetical protein
VSTFRSFFGDSVSTAYTVVLLLLSGMALVLGDAGVELERELAEGKKQGLSGLAKTPLGSPISVRFNPVHLTV